MTALLDELLIAAEENPDHLNELLKNYTPADFNTVDVYGHSLLYKLLQTYWPSLTFNNGLQYLSGMTVHALSVEMVKAEVTACAKKLKLKNLTVHVRADTSLIENLKTTPLSFSDQLTIDWKFTEIHHLQIASHLLDCIELVHFVDSLPLAVKRESEEMVNQLLKKYNRPVPEPILAEALREAAQAGNITILTLLLERCKQQTLDVQRYGLLHHVKKIDIAQVLLAHPIDIEHRDVKGNTALINAYERKNIDIIEFLQQQGANTECVNDNKQTIAHLAISHISLLKKLPEDQNLNAQDINGNTPCHLLFIQPNLKSINPQAIFLLDKEVDLTLENTNKETCLHVGLASLNRIKDDTQKRVLQQGKSALNVANIEGRTVIHHLLTRNRMLFNAHCQLLETLQADFNALDSENNTPLHLLLDKFNVNTRDADYITACNWLALRCPNPNQPNNQGNTLLHYFAKTGDLDNVVLLLERGGDASLLNNNNESPMSLALMEGSISIFLYLQEKGCSVTPISIQAIIDEENQWRAINQYFLLFPQTDKHKQQAIQLVLQALQFTRAAKNNESCFINYERSINLLISQYGKDNFIVVCKELFDRHRQSYDLKNVAPFGLHANIFAEDDYFMSTAQYFLGENYLLTPSMKCYGTWVPVKALFADTDFWKIIEVKQDPTLSLPLMNHLKKWPENLRACAPTSPRSLTTFHFLTNFFSEAKSFLSGDLTLRSLRSSTQTISPRDRFFGQNTSEDTTENASPRSVASENTF